MDLTNPSKKKDICYVAITLENFHIQVGNLTIKKPNYDPILIYKAGYKATSEIVTFDHECGKINEKHKAMLYENIFMSAYRDRLILFLRTGKRMYPKR